MDNARPGRCRPKVWGRFAFPRAPKPLIHIVWVSSFFSQRWPFGPPHLQLNLPKPNPPQKNTTIQKPNSKNEKGGSYQKPHFFLFQISSENNKLKKHYKNWHSSKPKNKLDQKVGGHILGNVCLLFSSSNCPFWGDVVS